MTKLKAERLRADEETGTELFRITGTVGGRPVDAVLEVGEDGDDMAWDEEADPCETAGIEPGDEDTGWDDVLEAVDAAP
jgi:hypothetical protein